MHQRAKLGGFFYPMLAAAILATGGGLRLGWAWAMPAVFLGLALLRLAAPPEPLDAAGSRRHLLRLWTLVLATGLAWGAFAAWGMRALPEPAPMVALLSSGAFGMALAHTMCMRRAPGALSIALVTLPALAVLALQAKPALVVVWVVYMLYMFMVMSRSHREYRARIELEEELRHQRNLFERQSRMDGLTGLANRREFIEVLERRLRDAPAGGGVGLLILDVDHFKAINDGFGHAGGDACLAALAQRLREHYAAPGELCARLGGEEFAVVFDPDAGDPAWRAETLRASLAEAPLAFEGGRHAVTASIGGACLDPDAPATADALYRQADAALYRAKVGGRNRVCWAGDGDRLATPAHDDVVRAGLH